MIEGGINVPGWAIIAAAAVWKIGDKLLGVVFKADNRYMTREACAGKHQLADANLRSADLLAQSNKAALDVENARRHTLADEVQKVSLRLVRVEEGQKYIGVAVDETKALVGKVFDKVDKLRGEE